MPNATKVDVIESAVDMLACNTPIAVAVNAGRRTSGTSGCATLVASLRNVGPKDGPEPESELRNRA
jgi:hypothetical protein